MVKIFENYGVVIEFEDENYYITADTGGIGGWMTRDETTLEEAELAQLGELQALEVLRAVDRRAGRL